MSERIAELVEGFRLSPQQERLARHGLGEGLAPYRVLCAVRVQGDLPEERLRAAVARVVRRHEILRTAFRWLPGMTAPLQVIREDAVFTLSVHEAAEAESLWRGALAQPFDLAEEPLLRLALIREGAREHRLIVALPALSADRAGMRNLVREIALAAAGAPEPEPPPQYADLAEAFLSLLESGEAEAGREMWRRIAPAAVPSLPLPGERPAPEAPFTPAEAVTRGPGLDTAVLDAARALGVSPRAFLLAAWAALLGRITGGPGVVDVASGGRTYGGLATAPGLFARWLPLAFRPAPDLPFAAWARQVEAELARLEEHQDFAGGGEDGGFSFELAETAVPVAAGGLTFSVEREHACLGGHRARLACRLAPGSLEIEILYDAARVPAEEAGRLAERFRRTAESAASRPDTALGELEILGEEERRRVVETLNATAVEWSGSLLVHERFRERARQDPGRVAVLGDGRSLTFGELDEQSDRLAGFLREQGVVAETVVGICLERSLEMVVALLAVLKAGGAYLPLDPDDPAERLALMLADARALLVLTTGRLAARLTPGRARIVLLDELPDAGTAPPEAAADPARLAYVIYTSGSTGRPKGVMIPHRGIANRLLWMARAFPLEPGDRVVQKTPLTFDAAGWEVLAPLLEGAAVVLARPGEHREPASLARLIAERQATVLQMVPPQLRAFLDEPEAASCRSLRRIYSGGDVLTGDLQERCFALLPASLCNLYGPTEASIDAAFWSCRPGETGNAPAGRPLDNVRIYLLDGAMAPVPFGAAGQIFLAGDGLARGYLGRPGATAERFVPDPFSPRPGERLYATGDLARYRADGALEFLGRADGQVKIRGVRLEPGEIEAALCRHPSVRTAVVAARPDAAGEKRLVAWVVPSGPGVPAAELRTFLEASLPAAAVPSAFVPLESLPQLPNGKVDRGALPEPGAREAGSGESAAPRTPTEELLAGIWADVLGLARAGIHESFFDLGGHSLLATRLVSRVRQVFDVEVSLRRLFEVPTVAGLAALVDAARREPGEAPAPPVKPVPREGALPLSFAQLRLWFLDRLHPGSVAFNISNVLELEGPLRVPALERAFAEVVRRHETLRSAFPTVEGEPSLVVAGEVPVRLPVVDLSALPEPARDAEERRQIDLETRRPFDLARGPLFRVSLLRLAPERHVVVLLLHHIVGDAWSTAVLVREVGTLYRAFAAGLPSPLPPLAVQYPDFAVWQRGWLQGEVLESQLRYWRERLSGAPPVLEIPADRPRPETQRLRGGARYLRLPLPVADALRALGRRQGATLFMVVLAAYDVLLHHLTGRTDVVVGTDIANRNRLETEGLIGFFVNQLVLRTSLAGDPTFRELLARVRETALGAYAHQDLPFERLIDLLQLGRDLKVPPVFQTKLFFQNVPAEAMELPGLTLTRRSSDSGAAKLDLTLAFWETPEGLSGWANYDADLFDAATIERLLGLFETVLRAVAEDDGRRVSDLARQLGDLERERRQKESRERQQSKFQKFKAGKPKAVGVGAAEVVERSSLSPGQSLPLVLEPRIGDLDLAEWSTAHRAEIEADLLRHGALLFRGFGVDSPEVFERFASSVCTELFDENGEHPRESVSGKVYTPVFYPPDQKLLWHNENSFNQRWPTRILFACQRPADRGGETPLVDSRRVYERLPAEVREEFERKGVAYLRNYGLGLGLGWQDVFQTSSREEVEQRCAAEGIGWEWKEEGRLRTRMVRPAVVRHPQTGEPVWFNQAQHWHTACLDPETRRSIASVYAEDDFPRSCSFGDGTPISDEIMELILEAYRRLEVSFPWQQGDVVLVDNVLAAHARNPFSGPRKLLVALGDMAGFLASDFPQGD